MKRLYSLALLVLSCDAELQECYGSSSCGPGQMCARDVCHVMCKSYRDCQDGELCEIVVMPSSLGYAGWKGAICIPREEVGEW